MASKWNVAMLAGKWAVVTGATSGIGESIVFALAGQGCNLTLLGRDAGKLQRLLSMLPAVHGKTYAVDLFDALAVTNCAQQLAGLPQVDLLVHCAGYIYLGSVETTPDHELDQQFAVNVKAPWILTRALLPSLRRSCGQVVFINSSAALGSARAQLGSYAASKFALKAMADSLRDEVNKDSVRVISIYPGRTATPMQAAVHSHEGKTYRPEDLLQPEDVAQSVLHALLLPTTAEVTDIAIRPMRKM